MIMIPLAESKFLRPNTYSQGKLRSKVSREPSTSLGVNHGRLDLLVGSNLSVCEPKGRQRVFQQRASASLYAVSPTEERRLPIKIP